MGNPSPFRSLAPVPCAYCPAPRPIAPLALPGLRLLAATARQSQPMSTWPRGRSCAPLLLACAGAYRIAQAQPVAIDRGRGCNSFVFRRLCQKWMGEGGSFRENQHNHQIWPAGLLLTLRWIAVLDRPPRHPQEPGVGGPLTLMPTRGHLGSWRRCGRRRCRLNQGPTGRSNRFVEAAGFQAAGSCATCPASDEIGRRVAWGNRAICPVDQWRSGAQFSASLRRRWQLDG